MFISTRIVKCGTIRGIVRVSCSVFSTHRLDLTTTGKFLLDAHSFLAAAPIFVCPVEIYYFSVCFLAGVFDLFTDALLLLRT
jgi:hypothetical protein